MSNFQKWQQTNYYNKKNVAIGKCMVCKRPDCNIYNTPRTRTFSSVIISNKPLFAIVPDIVEFKRKQENGRIFILTPSCDTLLNQFMNDDLFKIDTDKLDREKLDNILVALVTKNNKTLTFEAICKYDRILPTPFLTSYFLWKSYFNDKEWPTMLGQKFYEAR